MFDPKECNLNRMLYPFIDYFACYEIYFLLKVHFTTEPIKINVIFLAFGGGDWSYFIFVLLSTKRMSLNTSILKCAVFINVTGIIYSFIQCFRVI